MVDGVKMGYSLVLILVSWSKGFNSFRGNFQELGFYLEIEVVVVFYFWLFKFFLIYFKGL